MIKLRDIIQQLSLEYYVALNKKLIKNHKQKLCNCLVLFRTKLYTEEKMKQLLSLDNLAFVALKQNLKKEIYQILKINFEEYKSELIFKISKVSAKSNKNFTSNDSFELISLLQKLIDNNLEYEATPLFKKLAQLNQDSDIYEEYYNLYRTHFNIHQSTNRCITLFNSLNKHLGEYHHSNCVEQIHQINKTFLEIKNIHTFNENNLTTCLWNMSLIIISLFCKESKYAFTRDLSLYEALKFTKYKIDKLPESIERFYLGNLLYYSSRKLNRSYMLDDSTFEIINQIIRQKKNKTYFDFNFPKAISTNLISTNTNQQPGTMIIDFKKYRTNPKNIFKNSLFNNSNHYQMNIAIS